MDKITLADCKLNKIYRVVEVAGELKFRRRLLDFGFINCDVKVLHTSSLRGNFLVQIRGYVLAIRRAQASAVFVAEKI